MRKRLELMMKEARWPVLALTLGLGLGLVVIFLATPEVGLAQPAGMDARRSNEDPPALALTGRAPLLSASTGSRPSTVPPLGIGLMSISGSAVTTEDCYEANKTQTLCFTVYNGSTDAEWLDRVRLTFPTLLDPWTVACNSQDATDSSGNPVNLTCTTPFAYEVVYTDTNGTPGEVTAGSSWGFCTVVTVPAGYNGPRIINWGLSGDKGDEISGTLTIEECTPLMLKPSNMVVEGCNGVTQTLTFDLWNYSAGNGIFITLTYSVPSGSATLTGPSGFTMSNGDVVTFTVQLAPDLCLSAGTQVSATIEAEGNSQSDSSTITHTITALSGWQAQTSSITPTMDNVVVWASYADGGLWSIGGYGANGATQRYDPNTGTWSTHTPETVITPAIEYPMDGCYGLNDQDHEIVVLFPDTIVTGTLHVYDITADQWYTRPMPAGYALPEQGRWGQDIVSLLNVTGENVCYISGGATQEGGGNVKNLWWYRPDINQTVFLNNFSLVNTGFNFHASWYVPWVGNSGAICVGGGIDFKSSVISATQCYDLETSTFRGVNADLGPLPEPWWGMADGWQTYHGRHQIWIANGVAQNGTLLPASAYADETTGGFVYGPELPVGLYRLEGDGWNGHFYAEQGAAGSFIYSTYNQLLVQCSWCAEIYLPLVLRNHSN